MSENGLHRIPAMRTALEQIQELHPPIDTFNDGGLFCEHCHVLFPCETRVLADAGLGEANG